MLSKSRIKFITSLHRKKFRKEHGLFIAEGEKVCADLLASGFAVEAVYMTEDFRSGKFSSWKKKINAETIKEADLEKISALDTPQQILMLAQVPKRKLNVRLLEKELTLILDDISDPGNLGTILRISDWFGIKNIVCSETCTDAFAPKAVQASMGSLFHVQVFYAELPGVLKEFNEMNLPVIGTVLNGDNIYKASLPQHGAIVIGSESHGISPEILPLLSSKISIPSFSAGGNRAESLNAAMAAAIVCSEFKRMNN